MTKKDIIVVTERYTNPCIIIKKKTLIVVVVEKTFKSYWTYCMRQPIISTVSQDQLFA